MTVIIICYYYLYSILYIYATHMDVMHVLYKCNCITPLVACLHVCIYRPMHIAICLYIHKCIYNCGFGVRIFPLYPCACRKRRLKGGVCGSLVLTFAAARCKV